MRFRQLRYFCKIVECKSFTRAAATIHIAQPALSEQGLDLALVFEDDLGVSFTREPLYRQRLYVFHPRTMPIGSSVSLPELAQYRLVLPSRPNMVRASVDRAFAQASLVPTLVAEVDDYTSLLSTVRAGLGATLLPRGELAELGDDIAGPALIEPPLFMTVSIVSSNERPLSFAADEVRKLLRAFIERHVRETQPPGAASDGHTNFHPDGSHPVG
jgi:LysR family transcriptional regulator, nitrogen assimilation regulatory protein